MRQQMVLNAVHDAGEQWAAEAGNAAALSAYTEARAEAQTVSAYRAIGRQAETWVPLLRIVFECLYIGAFPMAVLLMLTPAGTAIFRSYVTGLVWLQSWGPLYAVLHRISMGEAAERMSAAASMPGGDIGISLVAQAGIRAVGSDVAVMSGYLSMSVPFLAAALAYGLSKATILATSVLAVGQDAASAAAHEGTTGNLSLANTGYDTHRFASLEGRQIRTSAHVDTDRYTGYAPAGAAMTVTGDGTVVADAGAATSRIPAAGVRLSESLATSHETRAAEARSLSRHWSAEAGMARNAAVTDATGLVERYSHDVSTGTAHARGVTESESASAQELQSHVDKLAEIGGLTKSQAMNLTGEAKVGGGWKHHREDRRRRLRHVARTDHRVRRLEPHAGIRPPARGDGDLVAGRRSLQAPFHAGPATARWRAWTRAFPPTSRACGASRNAPRWRARNRRPGPIRRRRCARTRRRSGASSASPSSPGSPSAPARTGAPSGPRGAMRIASPQTAEDAEALREHAAAFIAEKFPAPSGPDPATVGGAAEYGAARDTLSDAYTRETAAAYGGWAEGVRDRAYVADAPIPGEVGAAARGERAETETDMIVRGAARGARTEITRDTAREGRARVAVEEGRPFEEHATENLPFIGGWLAGQLFGTAKNAAPDGDGDGGENTGRVLDRKDWGDSSP